jgi:hypothetical protein
MFLNSEGTEDARSTLKDSLRASRTLVLRASSAPTALRIVLSSREC